VRVFTIGHGSRSSEELVECLAEAGVQTLVDVRRFPGSRRRRPPRPTCAGAAERAHEGSKARVSAHPRAGKRSEAERGERRERSDEFQSALATELAQPAPCFMCAETLWWQCHRRLIAELLAARGHDVVHLLRPGHPEPHRQWEPVADWRDGVLYLCGELVA
jgi:hypothetical protein